MRNLPIGKILISLVLVTVVICGIAFIFQNMANSGQPHPASNMAEVETDITSPTEPQYNWEIEGLIYSITEKNEVWWKFSWQATLKNNTSHQVNFFIDVRFLDKDGFIVDDDMENPLTFNPMEQRVVRGYALIDTEIAPNVKDIEAKVSAYTAD